VFVVHADHGEAFGEHGTYGHEPYLYEENVHVPLVVGGVPTERVERPVSLRSLPRLAVQLADDEWDPASLGTDFALSRTAGSERVALRGRRLKYIRSGTGSELYDLARGEQEPLADEELEALCHDRLQRFDTDRAETRAVRDAVGHLREVPA
jgi:arylsulfatase